MTNMDQVPGSSTAEAISSWGEHLKDELTGFEYEARDHTRTKLTVAIVVRPSNQVGSAFGTPFNAVTTDISAGGIGFLHTSAVPDKFLAITMTTNDGKATVLVEVVRCRSIGSFCEVGAKFLRLLEMNES